MARIIQLCELFEVWPGDILNDCSDKLIHLSIPVSEEESSDKRELRLLIEKSSDELAYSLNAVAQSMYRTIDQRHS